MAVTPLLHSKRGPSTAHRWRACPGSVAKSAGLPDTAGFEAAQGTVFHEFAAICVEHGFEPWEMIGRTMTVKGWGDLAFDAEMAENMMAGLDFLRALETPTTTTYVETRVSLHNWIGEDEFGTTDVAVIDPDANRLYVFDWKYGAGVPVQPYENDQAMLYALGIWDHAAEAIFEDAARYDMGEGMVDPEVWIVIEQPRAPGGGGVWKTKMSHILARGREIRRDADRTLDPNAPLVPGEKQCRFCAAAKHNTCEARASYLLDLINLDLDMLDVDFQVGKTYEFEPVMSPEARSQVLLHRPMIEEFLKTLHEKAEIDARAGRPVPGMKRVLGRRPGRKWKDADKMEPILRARIGDEAFLPRELRSPTQVEDTVGKKKFEIAFSAYVDQGEAKAILVPESDPRDPVPDVLSDLPDPLI